MPLPTFQDVQRAAVLLTGIAHNTPIHTSRQLNEISRATVFLKCENFQRVGAFKFRGAYNAVAHLQSDKPVIALSSGNHAQGIALASQLLGKDAHIVMPEPINPVKRAAVQGYGGIVHIPGNPQEAESFSQDLARDVQGEWIEAFNDPHVIAGQGTAALELLGQVNDLDVLLGPIGGGGLLSGTCLATHGVNPKIQVYACEPAGALDAMYSVKENRIVPQDNPQTIAEGLRTSVGTLTLPILREHLAGFFVVEEQEIGKAMRFIYERMKLIIEPASAVAVAPLLRQEPDLQNKRVGVIISGGNVDLSQYFNRLQGKPQ
ncbi:MAG: pyridoxal-phosphate dependent enzyme [Nitrospinae bacterium]|nr:pyridoxal-phosphate dependent enzyme [Nitrospinota bacterium]